MSKLNRRKNVPEKTSLRGSVLFRPTEETKTNLARLEMIEDYANNINFVRVKKAWNAIVETKNISNVGNKENKTLNLAMLSVKALLSERLFKTGITLVNGKRVFANVPYTFDYTKEKINIKWLLRKIEIYSNVINDPLLKPSNKSHLYKLSLGEWIMGIKGRNGEQYPSVLFRYCCGELETAYHDPHPESTKIVQRAYVLYTEQDRDFNGKEIQRFSLLAKKLIKFGERADVKRSHTLRRGSINKLAGNYMAILADNWGSDFADINPGYVVSDHAWNLFEKKVIL